MRIDCSKMTKREEILRGKAVVVRGCGCPDPSMFVRLDVTGKGGEDRRWERKGKSRSEFRINLCTKSRLAHGIMSSIEPHAISTLVAPRVSGAHAAKSQNRAKFSEFSLRNNGNAIVVSLGHFFD